MLAKSLQIKWNGAYWQDYYENIHQDISNRLSFKWSNGTTPQHFLGSKSSEMIRVLPKWVESGIPYTYALFSTDAQYSAVAAIGLARIHFPKAAHLVAPCYKSIATKSEYVFVCMDQNNFTNSADPGSFQELLHPLIALFRVITSCIAISIIEEVSGPGFHNVQHATKLNILQPENLTNLCQEVDNLAHSGLSISRCSRLVGYFHCALDAPCKVFRTNGECDADSSEMRFGTDEENETDSCIIAWRNGIHCVIPKLLISLTTGPTSSNLGFCCLDEFVVNLPVQKDGSIRSRKNRTFDEIPNHLALKNQKPNSDRESRFDQTFSSLSDVSIYLSVERPIGMDVTLLGICCRVSGEMVANFGVYPVLYAIIRAQESREAHRKICSGQTKPEATNLSPNLFKIASSFCAKHRFRLGGCPNSGTSIATKKEASWAIFKAGTLGEIYTVCPECKVQDPDSRKG